MRRATVGTGLGIALSLMLLGFALIALRAVPGSTPSGDVYPVVPTVTSGTYPVAAPPDSSVATPTATAILATRTPRPTLGPIPTLPPPPTPVTTTAQIGRDAAIRSALDSFPGLTGPDPAGRPVTVTAFLATHAFARSFAGIDQRVDPAMPVWIVVVQRPPWERWIGPVDRQIVATFGAIGIEVDALQGDVLGLWLITAQRVGEVVH